MNTPNHTPGPWKFDPVWSLIIGPEGGEQQIAAIHGSQLVPKRQAQANAALIAAATDLLAACQAVLRGLELSPLPGTETDMELLRAAIALAEKGQP
jgi:hypothetical protein